mgnify:FL=1
MKKFVYCLLLPFFLMQCEDEPGSEELEQGSGCGLDTLFNREVGGSGNTDGYDIVRLDDCSYVGVGKRSSRPWIMKIDEAGNELWSKIFEEVPIPQGNYSPGHQYATALDKTTDGGFILCTSVSTNHPSYNSTGYVIKTDSAGVTEWITELPSNRTHHGKDIIQTTEGDYVVVGIWFVSSAETSQKSAFMARYSESGSLSWIEHYGGDCDEDMFNAVVQKEDGGFIAVGQFEHEGGVYNCDFYGYTDLWFVNTDSEGHVIYESMVGGPFWEEATDILMLMDGSYAVSAKKRHTLNHPINAWLLNMDMTGNILWEWDEPDYSGGLRLGDDLQDIILSADGETIVAMGFTYDLPIDNIVPNVWAFDAVTSEQLWTNSYGGETGGTGRAGIVEAFDHGLVFFGYTNGKRLKIIKTDSTGFTIE